MWKWGLVPDWRERIFAFEAEQHSCQNQSWMGCSYPHPIRELFINAAANQTSAWFARSYLASITPTYRASCVHYVWLALSDPVSHAILEKWWGSCECHITAVFLYEQMAASVSVCRRREFDSILRSTRDILEMFILVVYLLVIVTSHWCPDYLNCFPKVNSVLL